MFFEQLYKLLAVSPMDRIAGAQEHFGKGMTNGKIITISGVIVLVLVLIIVGIIRSRK